MSKIKIKNLEKEIECGQEESLLDALRKNEIFIESPCGGKGTCGKCKFTDANTGVESLACKTFPKEDMEIELFHKGATDHRILTTGATREFKYNPSVIKKKFELIDTDIEEQLTVVDRIKTTLGIDYIPVDALYNISRKISEYTAVFYDDELINIEQGDTTSHIYGIAVDIGTTTVALSLINILTKETLASASDINAQKDFGHDVLSRITYLIDNEHGEKALQTAIVNQLNKLTNEVVDKTKINRDYIYDFIVSANSTMMHTLIGLDSTFIGTSPYAPIFNDSFVIDANKIGINLKNSKIYGIPAISSFIGADIVSGIYVSSLGERDGNVLFIDIGTNGEIVLLANKHLYSCSCAAGPALEGMNISIGMRAAEGAIEDIKIEEDKVVLATIGDIDPKGICGSGILSAMSELVRTGIVEKGGAFVKMESLEENDFRAKFIELDDKKRNFIVQNNPKLLLTQSDIRQIQLAKGAILSGFYALLNSANITMEDLDSVIIAGQFGSHLSTESLVGSGILPKEVEGKIEYVGNSSLSGAVMALLSNEVRIEMEKLKDRVEYVELSATEGYERLFAKCLRFN